jgi:hypothetical protein
MTVSTKLKLLDTGQRATLTLRWRDYGGTEKLTGTIAV